MTEFKKIVKLHAQTYPCMQPQDAVKLAYQSEFGGGHMIQDARSCCAYLEQEYKATSQQADTPIAEEIGSGMVRVQLNALAAAGVQPLQVARLFIASANDARGSIDGLRNKLACIQQLTEQGVFSFTVQAWERYLALYIQNGYPAVSHSAEYRAAYHPAYRVMDKRYFRLLPLLQRIDAVLTQKKRVTVAIEGRAASGKTTLAQQLQTVFGQDCTVLHMDDYFLPFDMRSETRYAEAGGNIHYERFMEEIASKLGQEIVTYAPFDCSTGVLGQSITQPLGRVTVIEGSYSMHPYFADPYDIHVFLELEPEVQKQRILKRNGPDWYEDFENYWIPMEEKYFAAYGVREHCEIIL